MGRTDRVGRRGVVVGQRVAQIIAEPRDRVTGRAPEPLRERAAVARRLAGADAVGRVKVAAQVAVETAPGGNSVGGRAVRVAAVA